MKPKPTQEPAIKVAMMPRDSNVHDTIFGGVILSYIDLAGAVQARLEGCYRCVTIAMNRIEFKLPVYIGDIVSFYTQTRRIGKTSITIQVDVFADRFKDRDEVVWVTEAEVTYVNVDEDRKPLEIKPKSGTA